METKTKKHGAYSGFEPDLLEGSPSFRASICTFAPLSVEAYDSDYILIYCSIDYHFGIVPQK